MFDSIAEIIRLIWQADTDRRDGSVTGESEMDRSSRRMVAWICGALIALLSVASALWWWLV
jgi:hypothetical protein